MRYCNSVVLKLRGMCNGPFSYLSIEEYKIDCVDVKISQRNGWMSWGSFAGTEKGLYLFLEKERGSIDVRA